MSNGTGWSKLNAQTYEEAGDWLVRHRAGSLDKGDKKAFDAWLRASPEHIRAYFGMSAVWEDTASLDPHWGAPAAELIARAAAEYSVLPMPGRRGSPAEREGFFEPAPGLPPTITARARWGSRLRLGIAVVLAVLCVCAGLMTWRVREPSYSTGIGEQRSVTLADGSIVELNARSEIRVHFVMRERDVELVRGQVLFRVAKDAARPFIVRVGNTLVRAVGTEFDVNESHAGMIVTVVEGRVAVSGPRASRLWAEAPLNKSAIPSHGEDGADLLKVLPENVRPIFLSAGEQLTITAKRLEEVEHVNVANATVWTQHRFVFDAAPLAEVVDEFNRYNARQFVITDPQLANLRIDGVFSSTDPSLLLRFLRAQPEIAIEETGGEIRVSRK